MFFALIAQLHTLTLKGIEKRRIAREFKRLESANATFKSELDETKKKMSEVAATLVKKGDAQEKKVIGELQIIEGLIREFASSIAKKAKEVPHPAPQTAQADTGDAHAGAARAAAGAYRRPAASRNHPPLARRKPRRSLSAADRQPAAAQGALLRSAVAAALRTTAR